MAKLMGDEKFRSLIKEEANKRFDGDYDILLKDLVQDIDFKNKINASLSADKKANVDQLLQENLRLNISVPLHNEAWKADKSQILVAGWKNEKSPFLNAYDSKGKVYVLSQEKSPNVPVMVIGYNERVDERGMLEKEYKKPASTASKIPDLRKNNFSVSSVTNAPQGVKITHQNSQNLDIYWDDLSDETGYEIWKSYGGGYSLLASLPANSNTYLDYVFLPGVRAYYQIRAIKNSVPQAWSVPITAVAAYRNNGAQLRIKRMRFIDENSLTAVEKWASGAPEIRLRVSRGNPLNINNGITTNTFGKYEPTHRSDIVNSWWNKEETILGSWSVNYYDTVLTFNWKEEDWNSFVDFKVTGKYEQKIGNGTITIGGEATFNNNKGSGNIGGDTDVFFWDSTYQTYETGGFQWEFFD